MIPKNNMATIFRRAAKAQTDPRWLLATQGARRWVNRMAARSDIAINILPNLPAPARFIHGSAEMELNEALLASVDPALVGSPEFVVKHPALAGLTVHEAAHARFPTGKGYLAMVNEFGERHAGIFYRLAEGWVERQIIDTGDLKPVEVEALKSMVIDIVLRGVTRNEDGTMPPMDMPMVLQIAGLTMTRIDGGIIDISLPAANRLNEGMIEALGVEYGPLFEIASKFSKIRLDRYYRTEEDWKRMHDLVREWIKIEDRLLPPPPEDGDGGDGEEGEEGEEGGGEGKSKSKSKSESKDKSKDKSDGGGKSEKSDESDEGEGEGGGDGDDGEDSSGDGDSGDGDQKGESGEVGDDDEGEEGDGSKELPPMTEQGQANLGDYAAFDTPKGEFDDLFRDVLNAAAVEAEAVSGSRLRDQLTAVRKADADAHRERRQKNKDAAHLWGKR